MNNNDPATEQSIAITKREIEGLKRALETDIDITDEIAYSEEQIEKLLKKLPVVMFNAAQKVVLRLIDLKEAKRMLRKVTAMQMMIARAKPELTAVGDRKAWAEQSPEVEAAEIAVINAEAEYRAAEFHYEAYDNLYTAIKKLSQMKIEQNKAQERAGA